MLSNMALGREEVHKPKYIQIENQNEAYSLIDNANKIIIHTDVDMDGFWSGYIMIKWLTSINKKPIGIILNNGKKHGADGISKERVGEADLLIVLDSSTNNLRQIIEDTGINVLIIDHHEINSGVELRVENSGRVGLVVNNMTIGDPNFSAGLLVYEFIRAKSLYDEKLIENMTLYQNATFSLVTDCIKMDNERNLWYAENTFRSNEVESTLEKLLSAASRYDKTMNKSVILYNIAPIFNKAIRAYRGDIALMYLLKQPEWVGELLQYGEIQDYFVKLAIEHEFSCDNGYVLADLGSLGIPDTYCGVIASKLVEKYNKSCVCLVNNKGSFRGLIQDDDCRYLDIIRESGCDIKADGHQTAFGISGSLLEINKALSFMVEREPEAIPRIAISLGNTGVTGWMCNAQSNEEWMQQKRKGVLVELARANGLVSVSEQEYIAVPRKDIKCLGNYEKYSKYESWGMEFISMEPLDNSYYIKIYAEDNGREIKFFARK